MAVDDTYSALGNVQINVPSSGGLTSNDSDADGGSVAAVPGTTTSANGGNVTVNADGSFDYNPPPGFEGADTSPSIAGAGPPSNTATGTVKKSRHDWLCESRGGLGRRGPMTSPFTP